MTARPPLGQIEDHRERVWRVAYDHDDRNTASSIVAALRDACAQIERLAERLRDDDLRAEVLHRHTGVTAYLADAAGDVATFFDVWDDRRAGRAQDAKDNRAADAADARITW